MTDDHTHAPSFPNDPPRNTENVYKPQYPPTIGTSLCVMFFQTTAAARLPFRINERWNNASCIRRDRGEKIQYNALRKHFCPLAIFISECIDFAMGNFDLESLRLWMSIVCVCFSFGSEIGSLFAVSSADWNWLFGL